jgi:hypothetical protein
LPRALAHPDPPLSDGVIALRPCTDAAGCHRANAPVLRRPELDDLPGRFFARLRG